MDQDRIGALAVSAARLAPAALPLTPAATVMAAGLCDKRAGAGESATPSKGSGMKLASIRLIVADIRAVVQFYETVTGQAAIWPAPVFAEILTPGATLAIGSVETVALFEEGSAEPAANRSAIIEFRVDHVDAVFERVKDGVIVVQEPQLMPWGNKAALFRDPEGTLVSLFTPFTDDAKRRFADRR